MVVPRGGSASSAERVAPSLAGELYCPFELRRNPHAPSAQQESVAWALELGLVSEGPKLAKLEKACLGDLAAFTFPDVPAEVLALVTIWTTLFCAIDDHVEESGLGALALSGYLADVLAAFRGRPDNRRDATARSFADFGRRLRKLTGAPIADQFDAELERLFTAYVWEEINRQNEANLDYAAYRILRLTTIGLRLQFLFSRAASPWGAATADSSPLVGELERATCHAVGFANDIFTYEKELAAGEAHNLVAVLMRTEGLPVREALLRARSLHDEEICLFLRLQARLRATDGGDEAVEYRLAHLRDWLSGHLYWAVRNGRYRPVVVAA